MDEPTPMLPEGIPTTTPSRTLIDLAEVMGADELREAFAPRRAEVAA
jgi:hypothetical protein